MDLLRNGPIGLTWTGLYLPLRLSTTGAFSVCESVFDPSNSVSSSSSSSSKSSPSTSSCSSSLGSSVGGTRGLNRSLLGRSPLPTLGLFGATTGVGRLPLGLGVVVVGALVRKLPLLLVVVEGLGVVGVTLLALGNGGLLNLNKGFWFLLTTLSVVDRGRVVSTSV